MIASEVALALPTVSVVSAKAGAARKNAMAVMAAKLPRRCCVIIETSQFRAPSSRKALLRWQTILSHRAAPASALRRRAQEIFRKGVIDAFGADELRGRIGDQRRH